MKASSEINIHQLISITLRLVHRSQSCTEFQKMKKTFRPCPKQPTKSNWQNYLKQTIENKVLQEASLNK